MSLILKKSLELPYNYMFIFEVKLRACDANIVTIYFKKLNAARK
jgi:hypothetical protein